MISKELEEEIKNSLLPKPEEENMLEYYSGKELLVPFASNVSGGRLFMDASKTTQYVEPIKPEIPFCDTVYAKDIYRSTENVLAEGDTEILHVIEKKIKGKKTATKAVIYKTDGVIHLLLDDGYKETSEEYGFKKVTDVKEGDKLIKGQPILRAHAFDKDMNYRSGVNARHIYMTSWSVLEDACVITDEFAKRCAVYKVYDVQLEVDLNNTVFKNLYGDIREYKPFPLINEFVMRNTKNTYTNTEGILLAYSNKASSMSFIRNDINIMKVSLDDIVKVYPNKAKVVDINVRMKRGELCPSPFFKALLDDCRKFEDDIYYTLESYIAYNETLSSDAMEWFEKERCVRELKFGYRRGKNYIPHNNILIDIKLVYTSVPMVGQKFTGNHGNKGVCGTVIKTDTTIVSDEYELPVVGVIKNKITTADGVPIDYITSTAGVPNRANPAQLMVKTMNGMAYHMRQYLKENRDAFGDDKVVEIFEKFISIFTKDQADVVRSMYKDFGKEFVDHIIDNQWKWRLEPYSHGITPRSFVIAVKLFKELGVKFDDGLEEYLGKHWIYVDGKKSFLAEVGYLYVYVMKQDAIKQMSVRTKGAYNESGSISRTGDKKAHTERYGNTPIQESSEDISIKLAVNSEEVVQTMMSGTDSQVVESLAAHFAILGIKFVTEGDEL